MKINIYVTVYFSDKILYGHKRVLGSPYDWTTRTVPYGRKIRRSKQTKFCGPFSSWQTTTILQIYITISTKFPNCQNHSRQRCLRSTGNLTILTYLKISSKRASKFTIRWLKITESTTSTLSWGELHYRHLKTLLAQPGRI